MPHLRRSLVDKIPVTAQEAMQLIAALLSSESKSAAANVAEDSDDYANYGLGRKFGGKAIREVR